MQQKQSIMEMQRHIEACAKHIRKLDGGCYSKEKINTLLDTAMQQLEVSCIEMRRLAEAMRPRVPELRVDWGHYNNQTIYGDVELLDTGWLHIRLEALLPHCKAAGGTQYVTDSITRLLDEYMQDGGILPMYDKAFLAIVEHCNFDCSSVYDHDNKGFKAVQNALKGRLFPDDNQFELSLGLFTVRDSNASCCRIFVLPDDEAGDFMYWREELGYA